LRFCVTLGHFGFVFSNFVLLGLVFPIPSQEIGWEERHAAGLLLAGCRSIAARDRAAASVNAVNDPRRIDADFAVVSRKPNKA